MFDAPAHTNGAAAATSCLQCSWPYDPAAMAAAFAEAHAALAASEVAVGCVLVDMTTGQIVARGRNATNQRMHALAHAEFMAIEQLQLRDDEGALEEDKAQSPHATLSGVERRQDLSGMCLYVTVEPCIMCAAMLLYTKIGHVFYGARNPRFGGNGTVVDVRDGAMRKKPQPLLIATHGCTDDISGCGDAHTAAGSTCRDAANAPARGYCSDGGHRADDAIQLLLHFYGHENGAAPNAKRRRKEPLAPAAGPL